MPARCQAFSLVEMLVVVVIISLLMSMIVPSVTSMLSSTNMTQAGKTVADQFSAARQIASSRNCTVEVRLIKLANISAKGYSAIQLWLSGTNSSLTPAGKMVYLPQSTVISEDSTKVSQMLSSLTSGTMPAGGSASNAPYVSFSFRPSGQVVPVLSGTTQRASLYLTVVPARLATGTTVPANYATIQLNPDSGSALLFRP
jgi:uncharacterized protein (TIGR02596 family)